MNFEKIEQAYSLLLENVQELQNTLLTNFYDALVEQNGVYLDGNTELAFGQATEEDESRARERYALPERYLLYVGSIETRKNLRQAVEALAHCRDRHIRLVAEIGRAHV